MVCVKCKSEIPVGANFCPTCGKKQTATKSQKTRLRGNGQGTAFRRGKTWTAAAIVGWRWDETDPEHPIRRRVTRTKGGFRTKAEALAYIPSLRNEQPKGAVTLESLWLIWKDNAMQKLSKSKQTAYRIAHGKIDSVLYCDIKTLTIGQLQDLINDKAPTYYTARDIKTLLSHLYTMAAAQQDVPTNLAEYIVLPTLDEAEQTPFSTEEQNALWADYAAGNEFTGYVLLMIHTGMMPGELFDARKDMVDFESKTIIGCGKKTKKRKQTPLVICDAIEPVLRQICDTVPGVKLLRMNRDNFYAAFKETMVRCKCRPLTPYACRHTTASALALQDIPPSVIQEVMRHTKFTTTQRYIHIGVAPMLDAVNKFSKPEEQAKPCE